MTSVEKYFPMQMLYTAETRRPRIPRQARQLTLARNVEDFGHVALFIEPKGPRT